MRWTRRRAGVFDAHDWKRCVAEKLDHIDCRALVDDVSDFLERPGDAALLTREHLLSVL